MSGSGRMRGIIDKFMGGRGEQSITVPVMDGALKPNIYLELMASVASIEGADNLIDAKGSTLLSSGNRLIALQQDGGTDVRSYEAEITFLAASPKGAIAVGLDRAGIAIAGGPHDGKRIPATLSGHTINCPTAAVFLDEYTLVVCNGSNTSSAVAWSADLLNLGRSGSVVLVDLAQDKARPIREGLGFPAGIAAAPDGKLIVAEAWRHRLVALDRDRGGIEIVLADLPAYPGRIIGSREGGYWVAMFAIRSQLQEFVLCEHRYRREMMATIDPAYWIVPALSSGRSFKEPLQAGSVIRLGIHKPWAPTRSYGLLVRLDGSFEPVWSAHSRADGSRHGITSCVEVGGRLLVTSKGAGEVLGLDHLMPTEPDDIVLQAGSAA